MIKLHEDERGVIGTSRCNFGEKKISTNPRGNLPTKEGESFIGNNWIVIRIHVRGWKEGGERIWTNFEAHGFSIFRTRHCWFPMLRRILIYLFKLKINLTPFSLFLFPSLYGGGNKAKFGWYPARDNKDTGAFTADPYNSLHPAGVSLTRCCAALHTMRTPFLRSPRFLVHGHV